MQFQFSTCHEIRHLLSHSSRLHSLELMILVSYYIYIVSVYNVHVLFLKQNFHDYLAVVQRLRTFHSGFPLPKMFS